MAVLHAPHERTGNPMGLKSSYTNKEVKEATAEAIIAVKNLHVWTKADFDLLSAVETGAMWLRLTKKTTTNSCHAAKFTITGNFDMLVSSLILS